MSQKYERPPIKTDKVSTHLARVAWLLYEDDPTPENFQLWLDKCERILDDSR